MNKSTNFYKIFSWFFAIIFIITSSTALFAISVESLTKPEDKTYQGQSSKTAQESEFAGKVIEHQAKPKAPYKDPRLACLLSMLVPPGGGGHFYLRQDMKGVLFCLGVSVGYLASAYFIFLGFTNSSTSSYVIGTISGLVGIIVHIVSMVEAYNDAIEINEAQYYKEY
jgi:hypothetical protein